MEQLSDIENSFRKSLKELGSLYILKRLSLEKAHPFKLPIKLQILLSSSMFKIQTHSEDLIAQIEQERFFSAIASIRMMLEEAMVITFALSELDKLSDEDKLDDFFNKLTIGRKTQDPKVAPYNINTVGETAEKFLKEKYPKLAGLYRDTYDYLSEYVHPNGPSRHYFWKRDGKTIHFRKPPFTTTDAVELYTYGCMTLDIYQLIYKQIKKLKLPDVAVIGRETTEA